MREVECSEVDMVAYKIYVKNNEDYEYCMYSLQDFCRLNIHLKYLVEARTILRNRKIKKVQTKIKENE